MAAGVNRYSENENRSTICSGPTRDPGHPWMARCPWMAWQYSSGPSTDFPDGLAFPTKMKTFWVIKYLNIYSTNR